MNILHIIPSLQKGGAERIALNICNELQKREGIKVKLIAFRDENAYSFLSDSIDYEVIPSHFTPSIRGRNDIDIKQLQQAVDSFQPDVIHLHLFESVMVASAINCPNAKWVIHFHDNMNQLTKWKWRHLFGKKALTDSYERQIVFKQFKKRKKQCIAISKDTQVFIEQNLGNIFPTRLLHNAIDTKRFSSSIMERIPGRIVTIGSLVEKKGQELAIRVVDVLHKRGLYVQLDILGDGPLRSQLEALVIDLNLEDKVIFHGNVDYPEKFLVQAEIYLHTAIYEPFGLVLIEAMAAGLPVVCTDGKGNRDLIIEGKNGIMVWERDVELLADNIEILIRNEKLRINMGEKAQRFTEEFGIEQYVNKLCNIYSETDLHF